MKYTTTLLLMCASVVGAARHDAEVSPVGTTEHTHRG